MAAASSGLKIYCALGRVVFTLGGEYHRLEVCDSTEWNRFGKFTVVSIARDCVLVLNCWNEVKRIIQLQPREFAFASTGSQPVRKFMANNSREWQVILASEACEVLRHLEVFVVDKALAELNFERNRPRVKISDLPKYVFGPADMRLESSPGAKFAMKVHAQRLSLEAVINSGIRGDDAVYAAARAFDDPDHVAVVYNPDRTPREVFWKGRKIAD